MQRKLTAEERKIFLENPEFVMFCPKGTGYLWLLLSGEVIFFIAMIIGLIFRKTVSFFDTGLFIGTTVTGLLAWGPVVILVMFLMSIPDRVKPNKRQQKTHYLRELRKSLPKELTINIATIKYAVPHDGVIYFVVDGKEDGWGLISGFVNTFDLGDSGAKIIIVFGKNFRAFIKRAPQTEVLYESFLQDGGCEE